MTHLGVRTDEEWEQDKMAAIRRAFETGEVVVGSRDLPEDAARAASAPDEPRRCWLSGCDNLATFEDWAGWHWCDAHKDTYGHDPDPVVQQRMAVPDHRKVSKWGQWIARWRAPR